MFKIFRKWQIIETHDEKALYEFLNIMSKHDFITYAVRERPDYLRPDVSYNELTKMFPSRYVSAPMITIYVKANDKEFEYVFDVWRSIVCTPPKLYSSPLINSPSMMCNQINSLNAVSSQTQTLRDQINQSDRFRTMSMKDEILYADNEPYIHLKM